MTGKTLFRRGRREAPKATIDFARDELCACPREMISIPIQQTATGFEDARVATAKQVFRVHGPQQTALLERADIAFGAPVLGERLRAGQPEKVLRDSPFARHAERGRQVVLVFRHVQYDAYGAIGRVCFAQRLAESSLENRL